MVAARAISANLFPPNRPPLGSLRLEGATGWYALWFLNSVVQLATRYEKRYESEEVVVLSLKVRR